MSTTPTWFCRPSARHWRVAVPATGAPAFHAELPGYRPTDLTELPALAEELDVGRVFVKDESTRMGLGAFKVLGASWAIARLLADTEDGGRVTLGELLRAAAAHPVELVTATDGNHGRAVAWMARLLGLEARVFVPRAVSEQARAAITAEGATVIVAGGSYDGAVEQAAAYADQQSAGVGRLLVQDTAWAGYESVPRWIVEGYGTLLAEVDQQLAEQGLPGPDLVSVPVGVGSLAQAVVTHYRRAERGPDGGGVVRDSSALRDSSELSGSGTARGDQAPAVLAVEPETAAAVLGSLQAGALRSVPTPGTVMAGLDCGTPSSLAWPVLAGGLDAAIAVADRLAIEAGADLRRLGVRSGPSGAASLAGVRTALTGPGAAARRAELGVTTSSVVLLLSTEGTGRNGGR